jgi:hypothetical protein
MALRDTLRFSEVFLFVILQGVAAVWYSTQAWMEKRYLVGMRWKCVACGMAHDSRRIVHLE